MEGFVLGMPDAEAGEDKRSWIFTRGRGLFRTGAPADSCRQELRSSFCHRAYARSSVTKNTPESAAAAGHGCLSAAAGRTSCHSTDSRFSFHTDSPIWILSSRICGIDQSRGRARQRTRVRSVC